MPVATYLSTTIDLTAETILNLGKGGGFRKDPTINNTTGTTVTYPAEQIRADKTGTTIRTIRGYTINVYPPYNPPINPTANPTNPTTPTNPTEATQKDITLTSTILLYFDAVSTTIYTINQPYGQATNIYDQILVGNWIGYLTAEAKSLKNIIPYSGVLLGENKATDLRLTNTTVTFTTSKIKAGTQKSSGDGLVVVWTQGGSPIDAEKYKNLTNQGYKIPPIGKTGYSQSTVNLTFTLNGPST